MSQTCFYYFNGTAFPVATYPYVDLTSRAHDVLTSGVRKGETLKNIGDYCMEQLKAWEKLMCIAMEGKLYTKTATAKWVDMVNEYQKKIGWSDKNLTMEEMHVIWICNIHILLKLKRIENDNKNGTLFFEGNTIPLFCETY